MKTKLLTICLLLFTSQVFAEELMMKCGENLYKFTNNLQEKKLELRSNLEWYNLCASEERTCEFRDKGLVLREKGHTIYWQYDFLLYEVRGVWDEENHVSKGEPCSKYPKN